MTELVIKHSNSITQIITGTCFYYDSDNFHLVADGIIKSNNITWECVVCNMPYDAFPSRQIVDSHLEKCLAKIECSEAKLNIMGLTISKFFSSNSWDCCTRCGCKMLARKYEKEEADVGVKRYECDCFSSPNWKAKICLLCVSQNKPREVSHIDDRLDSTCRSRELILLAKHFMDEHILPSINTIPKNGKTKADVTDYLIRYEATSDELGRQILCDNFLSTVFKIPQLCYLIPLVPYDLIISDNERTHTGGFVDFKKYTNIRDEHMTYVVRYLQEQSYACLYCGKEYDSLPTMQLIKNHDCRRQSAAL